LSQFSRCRTDGSVSPPAPPTASAVSPLRTFERRRCKIVRSVVHRPRSAARRRHRRLAKRDGSSTATSSRQRERGAHCANSPTTRCSWKGTTSTGCRVKSPRHASASPGPGRDPADQERQRRPPIRSVAPRSGGRNFKRRSSAIARRWGRAGRGWKAFGHLLGGSARTWGRAVPCPVPPGGHPLRQARRTANRLHRPPRMQPAVTIAKDPPDSREGMQNRQTLLAKGRRHHPRNYVSAPALSVAVADTWPVIWPCQPDVRGMVAVRTTGCKPTTRHVSAPRRREAAPGSAHHELVGFTRRHGDDLTRVADLSTIAEDEVAGARITPPNAVSPLARPPPRSRSRR